MRAKPGYISPFRWHNSGRWEEGLTQMAAWLEEGKITSRETVLEGFENLPAAFIGLLSGDNLGKMIVRA